MGYYNKVKEIYSNYNDKLYYLANSLIDLLEEREKIIEHNEDTGDINLRFQEDINKYVNEKKKFIEEYIAVTEEHIFRQRLLCLSLAFAFAVLFIRALIKYFTGIGITSMYLIWSVVICALLLVIIIPNVVGLVRYSKILKTMSVRFDFLNLYKCDTMHDVDFKEVSLRIFHEIGLLDLVMYEGRMKLQFAINHLAFVPCDEMDVIGNDHIVYVLTLNQYAERICENMYESNDELSDYIERFKKAKIGLINYRKKSRSTNLW